MDATKKDGLIAAGIDVNDVLERFMGNETLLEKMLEKFVDNPYFPRLLAAAACGDGEEGLIVAHALKGLCGNLAITELYSLFSRQVRVFRSDDVAGAFAMLPEITAAYERTVHAIRAVG